MKMKGIVVYTPVKSPNKPFLIDGKYYNRDEAAALGFDIGCHNAIMMYGWMADTEVVDNGDGSASFKGALVGMGF